MDRSIHEIRILDNRGIRIGGQSGIRIEDNRGWMNVLRIMKDGWMFRR